MPYLPIDPGDLGRSYDAVIRVNSQSGKGGIAYLLERDYGIEMPRRMQIDFARHVQQHTDNTGLEVDSAHLWTIFERTYLTPKTHTVEVRELDVTTVRETTHVTLRVGIEGTEHVGTFSDVGPVEAITLLLAANGVPLEVLSLHQTALTAGNDSDALTLLEYRCGSVTGWTAGRHRSVLDATVLAVVRATAMTPRFRAITENRRSPVTSTEEFHRTI